MTTTSTYTESTALTGLLEHVPGAGRLVIATQAQPQPHPAHPTPDPPVPARDRARRTAWHRNRRRALAYGRWAPTPQLDPAQARDHLHQLRQLGLSLTGISALCGQPESTLVSLLYPQSRSYRRWITPTTHDAIISAWLDLDRLPAEQRLSAAGTVRRLQALAAIGWSLSALARQLGVSVQSVHHTRTRAKVRADKARAVRDLYQRLQLTPGGSVRTVRQAAQSGWLPPLAWDDDTIDLPWATPFTQEQLAQPPRSQNTRWTGQDDQLVDLVVIARALQGEHLPMTHTEWLAAITAGTQRGWSDAQIAERLGVCQRTIERARAQHAIPTGWSASA